MVLLVATLFHAVRLERALWCAEARPRRWKTLVAGFNASTRAGRVGIERLRAAADGAGRQIKRQIDELDVAEGRPDFLIERGERLADRLEMPGARRRGRSRRGADRALRSQAPPMAERVPRRGPQCAARPSGLLQALRMAR